MGDPFLFRRTIQYLTEGSYTVESVSDRLNAGFRELEVNMEQMGELGACLQMRKKFCAYSSGIRGGSQLRARLVHAESAQDYRDILSGYLS